MKFDFSESQITLVVAPVDMRAGFSRLASMAEAFLGIDVFNVSSPKLWKPQKNQALAARQAPVA